MASRAQFAEPAPKNSGTAEVKWVVPEKFFDQLADLLAGVPPRPGEEALYRMIKSVLDAAKGAELKAMLGQKAIEAEEELIHPLFEFSGSDCPVGNGWTSPQNETHCIYTDFDSRGEALTGARRYTVTFKKGELPQVNGFWSMTLYNKEHLFVPNKLNRFSLGTKSNSLKFGNDGSLTLYFQNDLPAADKESNWLPAPQDAFSLYIRAYWPKAEILDGNWIPPAVERVG